ncbi:MAG: hypothetical protein HFH41_07550 [Lachnospiraceae bacterium]|nr:hypothetical protein [Lachnospiraceae bacterium]
MQEKSIVRQIKNIFTKIRGFGRKSQRKEEPEWEEIEEGNPFLPKLRMILEQVLEIYGISYQKFSPILIDTDTPPESMLDEDDVALVLEQISPDLNFLKIVTDRPAYFQAYIERMYEDTGLVVQMEEPGQVSPEGVNVVLDMEKQGNYHSQFVREGTLYLPIYKRPWSKVKILQNLDISVPIGYNTVIVKGR